MTRSTIRGVAVYCASSQSCDPVYHEAARDVGRRIAMQGWNLIYGGGAVGSMGAVADGALTAGGQVTGVLPRFMDELEWGHGRITNLCLVEDMRERKHAMLYLADAIVTLPGGTGTLEELLEALTLKRLGFHGKPIVIVNTRGFFDPLLACLERSVEESFMGQQHREMWCSISEAEQLVEAIQSMPAWPENARHFAAI